MTIPHLKNRVSLMVEMLKVKTCPSTLWGNFEFLLPIELDAIHVHVCKGWMMPFYLALIISTLLHCSKETVNELITAWQVKVNKRRLNLPLPFMYC